MRRKNMKIRALVICLSALLTLARAPAFASWVTEAVDENDYVGRNSSIALDSGENPHISYYDAVNRDLKYAHYDGTTWHIEVVDTIGFVGEYTSLALDSGDNPHISYYRALEDDLKYAYWTGSSWDITSVDTVGDVGWTTSIALDSGDNPHISYWDLTNFGLKYAYWTGAAWSITSITIGDAYYGTSIALDSGDNPHITYSADNPNLDRMYAYRTGSTWSITYVDAGGWASGSIALDSGDNPHISYSDQNNIFKYAYWTGSEWSITSVDTGHVFGSSSIALDSGDNPHISYGDAHDGLEYAYYDGASWDIETIDAGGGSPSIALNTGGNPHISYYGGHNLKYAWYNVQPTTFDLSQPPDGAEVAEPVTLDWEDSTDDDGDTVTYDVWYSTNPSFDPRDEVTELTDSTYTFPEGVLSDGTTYYWKVRAWDGYEGTWSGPDPYWSFTVDNELDIPVTAFSAESAHNGIKLTWECVEPGVGFNLYRSEEATGARTKIREMLNAELITGESPYTYLNAEVSDGVIYVYWLEAIDLSGSSETFGPVSCTAGMFVPTAYALYQSRPNPARGTAVIAFDLPEDTEVTLTVYDLSGRKITTLVNETLPAGAYERTVSGLAPGVYVYRLEAGEFAAVKKMVVVQ